MGLKVVAVSDVSGGVTGYKSVNDLQKNAQENGEDIARANFQNISIL
jgi:hypothetical protein